MKTKLFFFGILFVTYTAAFSQANQTLSNLTSPTAVNKDIIAGADGTLDLGSKNFSWRNLYLKTGIYLKGKLSFQSPGTGNLFAGNNAGNSALTGMNNIAFGLFSLTKIAAGNYNTVIGDSALYNDSTGNNNSAVGFKTLYRNLAGSWNSAIGFDALYNNVYGNANTAMGMYALYNCSGSNNTAVGYSALGGNTSGLYNCGFGLNALNKNATGIGNSAFGYGTDVGQTNFSNVTVIGYNAVCDAANKVRIGNTSVTSIGGEVGWTSFSDGRYKKNIKENVPGLAFINALRPVSYTVDIDRLNNYYGKNNENKNDNADKIIYSGFIAQEVEAVAQKLDYDFSGVDKPKTTNGLYGLRYDNFVVPLVKAVQELSQMNNDKDVKIAAFQKQMDAQQNEIDELKLMIQNLAQNNSSFSKTNTTVTGALLEQNIPNPFSKNTIINYTLPQKFTNAQIVITAATGKSLQQINISGTGKGMIKVDAAVLSAGAYSYTLFIDGKAVQTKQMILTK